MKDSRAILESDLDKFLMGYCANNLEDKSYSMVWDSKRERVLLQEHPFKTSSKKI